MTRRELVTLAALLVAVCLLVAAWCVATPSPYANVPAPRGDSLYETEPRDVIWEDDPRWNCATMGNRICGPGHGAPLALVAEVRP